MGRFVPGLPCEALLATRKGLALVWLFLRKWVLTVDTFFAGTPKYKRGGRW